MDERLATARLTVDLAALIRNWRSLDNIVPPAATGAAVKSDGYGLGLVEVVTALTNAGCRHFFTANADEGLRARKVSPDAEIFVLAGLTGSNAAIYHEGGLTPVLNSIDDIALWAEWCRKIGMRRPCAIHVDTGMNRLGLSMEETLSFTGDADRLHSVTPSLVMSHLACADQPGNAMNAQQAALFDEVQTMFPGVRGSLANSAGLLTDKRYAHDITRPGIALYGGEAVDGLSTTTETVAMLEGRILQIRSASKGDTVGYGATAVLERDSRIAIAGLGYGDGVMRAASGSGVPMRSLSEGAHAHLAGHAVPVIGRISMDLTAFDVSDVPEATLESAQWIEMFGDNIALDDFARAAGTIGYELLTAMGNRAHRVYRGADE